MDKKRVITIAIMVLCLGIFFVSTYKDKKNKEQEQVLKVNKGTYEEGAFHDQGEMWDYLHSHAFVAKEGADSGVMTVQNYELFLNGKPFSSDLRVTDFKYSGVGFAGYNMKGESIFFIVSKNREECKLVDMTGYRHLTKESRLRIYVAQP